MIYKRQIIRELMLSSMSIFFILLIILVSIQLVNFLGKVARGVIGIDLFTTAISVSLISFMPLLLCVTCFISILTVLSRYWRGSEMIIWLTSGLSLKSWITPILIFSTPFVLILFLLTLYLVPKVNEKSLEYSELVKTKPTIDFVEQGVFVPISNGVIFIDEFDSKTGQLQSFFSHEVNPTAKKFEITLAKNGHIELNNKGIKISLYEANRYLGFPNQADFSVFTIPKVEYYMASAKSKSSQFDLYDQKNTANSLELWKSQNSILKSALMWRLALPLATLILAILAIPLSYVNTRSNKNYNVIIAILIFFFYHNGLILSRNLVAKGVINFWVGLLAVHVLMIILTMFYYYYRTMPKSSLKNFLVLVLKRG